MRIAGALGELVRFEDVDPSANGRLVFDRLTAADRDEKQAEVTRARNKWAVDHLTGSTEARRLADAWVARRRAVAARLTSASPPWAVSVVTLKVSRISALAVGHSGAGTAAETSLSLHPVTGQPWIAGSALKGSARAMRREDEEVVPSVDDLYGAGGETPAMGRVRVLDAIAHGDVQVREVVMTPHSPAYYQDPNKQPGRWENPVPVHFLVVERGTFTTLVIGRDADDVEAAAADLADAGDWLGLGAKTAAGFGYVEVTTEPYRAEA